MGPQEAALGTLITGVTDNRNPRGFLKTDGVLSFDATNLTMSRQFNQLKKAISTLETAFFLQVTLAELLSLHDKEFLTPFLAVVKDSPLFIIVDAASVNFFDYQPDDWNRLSQIFDNADAGFAFFSVALSNQDPATRKEISYDGFKKAVLKKEAIFLQQTAASESDAIAAFSKAGPNIQTQLQYLSLMSPEAGRLCLTEALQEVGIKVTPDFRALLNEDLKNILIAAKFLYQDRAWYDKKDWVLPFLLRRFGVEPEVFCDEKPELNTSSALFGFFPATVSELHRAVQEGQPALRWDEKNKMNEAQIAALLGWTAQLDCYASQLNQEGWNDLVFYAALSGSKETIHYLADKKGVNLKTVRGLKGQSVLHEAAFHGRDELVDELIHRVGFDVNVTDPRGRTALHCAAFSGHISTLSNLLFAHGAQLPKDILIYAARSGCTDVVDFLATQGADPAAFDQKGMTALHHAASQDNAVMVSYLLDKYHLGELAGDVLSKIKCNEEVHGILEKEAYGSAQSPAPSVHFGSS